MRPLLAAAALGFVAGRLLLGRARCSRPLAVWVCEYDPASGLRMRGAL